ncbi:RING finger protein 145-like isoform X1 [Pseudophryne corroboree]|uniref:RING finger protein 145-like isoform X1 n=1 Tax=Pseudophryne corroboree TaxID=495146 RepID=UPI003081F6C8
MSRLEPAANVILRVPGIVLLDLLYRWDIQELAESPHPTYLTSVFRTTYLQCAYYLAHLACAVLLLLPLWCLVSIYLYLLTVLLLYVAHQMVRDYIRQEMETGMSGSVYDDPASLTRSVSALVGLVMVGTLCSLLMRTRQLWLFSAPALPLLARMAMLPLLTLPLLNTVSTGLSLMVVFYIGLSSLRVLLSLFQEAWEEVLQVTEPYRLVALAMSLWSRLAVPLIFLVFWLVLFILHLHNTLSAKAGMLGLQGSVFIFLSSVAECCGTPYCLIGLTFTVSYLALGMLNLCKFFLLGFAAFENGNVVHRGVTEGVTLMLLAVQTGLLDLQVLQRTFLLSIILFIVVTSTLQSMIDIADPIVLALAATGNRSPWKHVRGVAVCLFLLVLPSVMAYKISSLFHMDFWLLILVSSCLLTSLQVLGTLFIYALFMVELFQDSRVGQMDEIIYGVNGVSRVLEFLVALCVVTYGMLESMFGEWSWLGVSILIVHSYFNLWLRAQSGWRSFLLRRDASKKIGSLPRATKGQLRVHNDICSICYQEMSVAVVTPCSHFFHADCLRRWLYVQDTCPLCYQQVKPPGAGRSDTESLTQEEDADPGSETGHAGAQEEVRPEMEAMEGSSTVEQVHAGLATAAGGHGGVVVTTDKEMVGR